VTSRVLRNLLEKSAGEAVVFYRLRLSVDSFFVSALLKNFQAFSSPPRKRSSATMEEEPECFVGKALFTSVLARCCAFPFSDFQIESGVHRF